MPRALSLLALVLIGATGLAAYGVEGLLRLPDGTWAVVVLISVTAGALLFPVAASCALLALLPLFGNHPGGRFMGLLNVPLAAATLGLTWRACRRREAAPGGSLWRAVALVLVSTVVALVPAIPGILVRAAQIDSLPLVVAMAVGAPEHDVLYPAACTLQLLLAAAWAYALCWSAPPPEFEAKALRAVAAGFFVTMALGVLDLHGLIDIRRDLQAPIDAHVDSLHRFASIFWNPSWFAWYFTIVFGLLLGLLVLSAPRMRLAFGAALAVSYLYYCANSSQRAGLVAVHATLLVLGAWLIAVRPARRGRAARVLSLAALAAVSWAIGLLVRLWKLHDDLPRWQLWKAALVMWRHAPLFGIGEGAFHLRYADFIAAGAPAGGLIWGDAHNTLLHVLATRGLFGLVALLALFVALARGVARGLRGTAPERAVALGVGLGLLAFTIYATVQAMFYLQAVQVLFFFMVALASRLPNPEEGGARWVTAPRFLAVAVAALLLQVALCGPLWAAAAAEVRRQPRGFYGVETRSTGSPVRWSARQGTLCLYPPARELRLRFMIPAVGRAAGPVRVDVGLEGRARDHFALETAETVRTIWLDAEELRPLPPPGAGTFGECVPGFRPLRLTVRVSRVFSPWSAQVRDNRFLGVALFAPEYRGELLQ